MQPKNGNNSGFSFSEEQLKKLLAGRDAQQLVKHLQKGGSSAIQTAAEAAQRGDITAAKAAVEALLQDRQTAELVKRLRNG